jgi:anion-transporting  ArsA/GET3 family ATPase
MKKLRFRLVTVGLGCTKPTFVLFITSVPAQGAMEEARRMFRDKDRTEFIIVSIPTVMAMVESERLALSLEKENVPCKRIVVNQMVRRCSHHLQYDPDLHQLSLWHC